MGAWRCGTPPRAGASGFLGYRGHAWALAFSPDGRYLALGGFGPTSPCATSRPKGAGRSLEMPIPEATALAFSSDGRILAAASRLTDGILLWDLAVRRERARLRGHSSPARSLAFSPDGRSLASGGGIRDQAIIVWDPAAGGRRLRLETPGFVRRWRTPRTGLARLGKRLRWFRPHLGPRRGSLGLLIGSRATSRYPMAFAPGGRLLAMADTTAR